jgi:hypothetical protein
MSFRLFIYYCALCGGWAAFGGWALGHALAPSTGIARTVLFGMSLGLVLSFGLGCIDALWNLGGRQYRAIAARAGTALGVGALGGICGGLVGYLLYDATGQDLFFVLGWTFTGVLIGSSIAAYEVITSFVGGKDKTAALKKLLKCTLGGTVGGVLGGSLALGLQVLFSKVFSGKDLASLWSPTSWGFVALGLLIGLLVGMAQVLLKEAWIKVEAGFRPGRELILSKASTSIGRAEGSDIALFGDNAIEKTHAHIVQQGGRYYLQPEAAAAVTFVNDQPLRGRTALQSGDLIRLGSRSVLRFYEKQKSQ